MPSNRGPQGRAAEAPPTQPALPFHLQLLAGCQLHFKHRPIAQKHKHGTMIQGRLQGKTEKKPENVSLLKVTSNVYYQPPAKIFKFLI